MTIKLALEKFTITGNSGAADTNNYANDIAPTTGVAVTLLATSAGDSLAHKVIVTNNSATDYSSAKTITIVGTLYGKPQSETIAGPGVSTTVTTTKYFSTVTSITPDFTRGTTDTFDIGWTADSVSDWTYLSSLTWGPNGVGFACVVDSGSPTYTVQQTYDGGVNAFNHSVVASKTAATAGVYSTPVQAVRINFTAAGGVSLHGYL